jgi:predicted RNase H-like HicB family nuclease
MRYLVVFEKPTTDERGEQSDFGAYSPDLPGVYAVGSTFEEVQQLIHEAIDFHIESLHELGLPAPQPWASEYHDIAVA